MLFETLDTLKPDEAFDDEWPSFSLDPYSRYSFFVSHTKGVYFFSLDPWLQAVENEYQNSSTDGTEFRINVLKNGPGVFRERILYLDTPELDGSRNKTTSCVVLEDSDLGYLLLTCSGEQPHAVIFDQPNVGLSDPWLLKEEEEYQPNQEVLTLGPVRCAYQPPASFWAPSSLTAFFDNQIQQRHKKTLKEEIRLSTNTLDLMTEAHRILSQDTHQLGLAAADLFRRCERLQDELRDQIKRTDEAARRIEQMVDENGDDYNVPEGTPGGKNRLEKRLQHALAKQRRLTDRHEYLRREVARSSAGGLSEKEEVWVAEIKKMGKLVIDDVEGKDQEEDERPLKPQQRYQEACYNSGSSRNPRTNRGYDNEQAKELAQDLISRAKQLTGGTPSNNHDDGNDANDDHPRSIRIPSELRRAKVDEVTRLLEREYV